MKKYLLVGILFIIAGGFANSNFAAEPSFNEEVKRKLSETIKGDTAGVAVLVARDGKILFQGGFGFADLEKKTPITPDTKFRIGSVSKQFTAAAILRLSEQEKLSLSDSLTKFFPEFSNCADVTVRHLLTHTSGLHSYTDKPDFITRVRDPIDPEKLIEWFQSDPPDFAPGAGFHYNNSAYFLLGEIVRKVSSKSLADYLKETFFDPLEMKNTGIYVNSAPPESMARGYSLKDGKLEPALDWDMSWAGGAGALYSTVEDLFRWNEALYSGRVVNEASFKSATTPVELPANVDGMKYGYGLMMFELKRLPAIGHGGGLNGWSSYLLRLPQQNCTIVVLANALPGPPETVPQSISREIIDKLLAEEIKNLPPLVEDKSVDPKTFPAYAGRFDYQNAIMTVTVEDDALFAKITGQEKRQIFPKAKDEFFWKVADAQVVFLRNEKGQVHAARHTQNGNTFTAVKLSDEWKLTPEQLEAFVGKYQYGLFAVMTVSRDGQQLFAQLTGQPKYPIFPTSETEFEWHAVKANVKFVNGDDGKVSKAVHHQNGTSFDAPKTK